MDMKHTQVKPSGRDGYYISIIYACQDPVEDLSLRRRLSGIVVPLIAAVLGLTWLYRLDRIDPRFWDARGLASGEGYSSGSAASPLQISPKRSEDVGTPC
ncbi:hypothetical protein BDW67DRAFT_16284 [Aspergillus spinulosporus]